MQEAIEEFIKYTELSEPTLEGRIVQYQQLLRGIATGSWSFSKEFQAWRKAYTEQSITAEATPAVPPLSPQ
jgi:hypothetical protein